MNLYRHPRGSPLRHCLQIHASLHILHSRGLSNQAVFSSSQTIAQVDEENTLGFEVESQRRFLSKLANDLSIHDVPSLSLSSSFPPVIFLYFPFIHQFC